MSDQSKIDAFVRAAANSRYAELKSLVAEGIDVNCRDSLWNDAALHRAADKGSKKVAEFLLDHGANIELLDYNDMTPLLLACATGKSRGSELALFLLNRGANASYVRQSDGMSAIKFALWGACTEELLAALVDAGAPLPDPKFKIIRLR